jgi:two-component sensor histidine kinase
MTPGEVRRRCRESPGLGVLLALILVAAALGVRLAAGDALRGFPFMTFFPAIAVATFMGDRRAGWVAGAASLVTVWYMFPLHHGMLGTVGDVRNLPVFAAIAATVVEVTAWLNRSSDAALRMAEENRILFMELRHRTANDLQMVSSLLSLHLSEATDESSRRLLGDAISRVRLLGDLHRQMYEPGAKSLDMRRFLGRLCADLGASLAQGPIACDVRADRILAPDSIVPLTMIVHELVSNALEHGGGAAGGRHVLVTFEPAHAGENTDGRGHRLSVEDDGPGMPPGFDPGQSKRLGMKLMKAFTTQIGGTLNWSPRPGGGTRATLNLPPIVGSQTLISSS